MFLQIPIQCDIYPSSVFRWRYRLHCIIQKPWVKRRRPGKKLHLPNRSCSNSPLGRHPQESTKTVSGCRRDVLDNRAIHALNRQLRGPVTFDTSSKDVTCTVCHESKKQSFHHGRWLIVSNLGFCYYIKGSQTHGRVGIPSTTHNDRYSRTIPFSTSPLDQVFAQATRKPFRD